MYVKQPFYCFPIRFEPGDIVRRGIHQGLHLGESGLVFHAPKGGWTQIVTESAFAEGEQLGLVSRLPLPGQRAAAVERALQLQDQPYDLLSANCEDWANRAQTGTAFSPTRQLLSVLAVGALVLSGGRGPRQSGQQPRRRPRARARR